ncbi:P-loop containing nucleoside triphosphate hydrolase protein [Fomitopsis betulina]|nr:P-loop containing nucleoside triphosphate hydrolase protein [Fomitopsis betulina]
MLTAIRGVLRITETRRRLRYRDGLIHFAVAGTAGSGKSSLINSIRGLRANDPGAAGVGASETTREVTRYEHPDLERHPYVWYDIPGVGTLNQPEEKYFLDQGLFIFDCIIILFDARFTAADIAILQCCQKLDIPAYIVRSKALLHIENMVEDMAGGEGGATGDRERCRGEARVKFRSETQATVNENLKAAGLEEQRVYIVDKKTMLQLFSNEDPRDNLLDERKLLCDVIREMERRRGT